MAESNPGAVGGLVKSKKYALTFAFVTTCFTLAVETSQQVFQIVLVGCATAAVLTYVAIQGLVESSGRSIEESETPALNGTATAGSDPPKVS